MFTWKSHAGHDLRILVDDHSLNQSDNCRFVHNPDEADGGRYPFRVDTVD